MRFVLRSLILTWVLVSLIYTAGCTRGHHRLRADADAYGRIVEKAMGKPWQVPSDYSVYPQAHSRLHDPTCVNDPCLPNPAPQLYAYDLPEMPERDIARFRPNRNTAEELPVPVGAPEKMYSPPVPDGSAEPDRTPAESVPSAQSPIQTPEPPAAVEHPKHESAESPFRTVSHRTLSDDYEALLVAQIQESPALPEPDVAELPKEEELTVPRQGEPSVVALEDIESDSDGELDPSKTGDEVKTRQVPLPPEYWESISNECLSRMFAFESVRDEYARTYGKQPEESQMDNSPKLALEDIIELTMLNSRELQAQKELLFRVALVLTLERFDYQLRPSFGNNGSAADFNHSRSQGVTENTLRIPTTFQLEKMMYSGADFIGRFANDVLLTFNGPQGFAVDVGSELLFGFSQSLLQRDVRLENLTQAERSVVYAARDFARFRRELFVQQASDYYSLIRQFRQIEIQCQNYFTLAREFNQRSVEIKYGFAARTQLDQVEQQVINGRQSILNACVNLENALDSLKIRMGIPTEEPLNIDLSELNIISLRDEMAVNAELIERTRGRILSGIDADDRSPFLIVGGASDLAEHMLDSLRIRKALGEESVDAEPLEKRLMELAIEASDIDVAEARTQLDEQLRNAEPDQNKVIFRRRDVAKELTKKLRLQIQLLRKLEVEDEQAENWESAYESFMDRLDMTRDTAADEPQFDQAPGADESPQDVLTRDVKTLQEDIELYTGDLDELLGRNAASSQAEFESRSIRYATEAMSESEAFRDGAAGGLVPIQMDMDDAMLTALVQRFDLMNQRGELADSWRQIKYAADDLRSVLNLNASQTIRNRSGQNKPFDFTFDDSNTSLGLSLDLPFNRRAQRNRFRASLFDYQQTLRNVMQLEDNVKLTVRRDLRTLKLDRQQYANDIAGAALASERVRGTETEVRLGVATSRDFLESQQAYVQAISGVASDHINYIVGRLDLFLDLEGLTVGDNGFWDQLYDENHQPEPSYQIPGYARPSYGNLHPRLKYSKKIRRMQCVPEGVPMVHERLDSKTTRLPSDVR